MIKENKELFLKYIFVLLSNILIYIFINFYFKSSSYKELYMLFSTIIIDMIIYYNKETKKFIWYYDFIINFVIGIILMIFIKDNLYYATVLFSLVLSNNIIFIKSRLNTNFFKRSLQYILMFINTLIIVFINLCIYYLIYYF